MNRPVLAVHSKRRPHLEAWPRKIILVIFQQRLLWQLAQAIRRRNWFLTIKARLHYHVRRLTNRVKISTTNGNCTQHYGGWVHRIIVSPKRSIPIMELLKAMKRKGFNVLDHKVKVHCRVLEDNSRAIWMTVFHKWRPRAKHLATKLHHFWSYVNSGEISVHNIDTSLQPADLLTKPLNTELLKRHQNTIMGC